MFTQTLALLLFPVLALAQYGASPDTSAASSASSTSSAAAVVQSAPADTPGHLNVNVFFNGNLVFNPANLTAPVGTLVTFYFPNAGMNHSVTQSTFGAPCTYLAANASTGAPPGFDSDLTEATTFTLNITDTNPIWYYCKHPAHCGMGMVGSINPPTAGNTFQKFQAAAFAVGAGEKITPDSGVVIGGVDASATGPPVPDVTSPSSSGSGSSSSPSSSPTSGAIKVPTSIGFAVFAAVLAVSMA